MNRIIPNQKDFLRNNFTEIRKESLFKNEKLIIEQLKNSLIKFNPITKGKGYIGIYWPIKGEVDIRFLKKLYMKRIALPACNKDKSITYHPWTNKTLGKDSLLIPAPVKERALKSNEVCLLLIPALAIDRNGYRLGYGGGYFDRLRKKLNWRKIPSFIIIPQSCISKDPLPIDPWDIPFDGWISENGIHKIHPKNSFN